MTEIPTLVVLGEASQQIHDLGAALIQPGLGLSADLTCVQELHPRVDQPLNLGRGFRQVLIDQIPDLAPRQVGLNAARAQLLELCALRVTTKLGLDSSEQGTILQ